MPKLTDDAMRARRESGLSAGGIYTHFADKHEIVAAIGRDATTSGEGAEGDWLARLAHLQSPAGQVDARLDLHLWSGALTDPVLHDQVSHAFDAARAGLAAASGTDVDGGHAALLEAVVLGLEVQRALGRALPEDLPARLRALLAGEGTP